MSRIAVLLADGFEEVEAVTPIDYLRRAQVEVIVTGVRSTTPKGSRGITVVTDSLIEDIGPVDGVVLPGGMPGSVNLAASAAVKSLCSQLMASGALVAAICAAPAVALGSFGLLKDRRFTCYPGFEKDVIDGVFSDERVVVDGNLITSRGPGTAGEFALALIRYLTDEKTAAEIAAAGLILQN